MNNKKAYSPKLKFDVVMETIETNNVAEISRKYTINANMISTWRKHHKENGYQVFETTANKEIVKLRGHLAKLEQLLGKKEVELALMKNFFDFHKPQSG